MKKALLSILFISVVCLSCGDDDPIRSSGENEYFPLKVGNYWKYETTNTGISASFESEITGTVVLNDHEYYVVATKSSWGSSLEATYYRMDDRGYVFELKPGYEKETNKYRLNAHENDSWEYTYGPDYPTGKMTFNGSQNVTLNTTTIDNCIGFSFDIEQSADEESYNVLAAGIGVVVTGGEIQYKLKQAVIDGHEFNF